MKPKNKEVSIVWPAGEENTIVFQPAIINIEITQSDWCGYEGKCKKDIANVWDICFICKHRIKLDIPAMLDKVHEEQNKGNVE
jgi:hypothetical protein